MIKKFVHEDGESKQENLNKIFPYFPNRYVCFGDNIMMIQQACEYIFYRLWIKLTSHKDWKNYSSFDLINGFTLYLIAIAFTTTTLYIYFLYSYRSKGKMTVHLSKCEIEHLLNPTYYNGLFNIVIYIYY